MRPEKKYYVTGGSLRADTPSYVARKADEELFQALKGGEFCYVLTSRQMGKTSLIVRTAAKLCAAGARIAVLDLTAIGQNVQPEQWYYGLLCRLGEQIGLEDELDEFWLAHDKLGPLQRWIAAIRSVALIPSAAPLVIFIDEIDAVRSLPIATAEFFAAIRECYNRRTQDAEFERLAFCLMGVASPTDLIRDTRTTPFNIGRRIELTDFTEAESAPLEGGLDGNLTDAFTDQSKRDKKNLLRRILRWTGGHPYLTQRFCKAVADAPQIRTDSDIDRLCHELYLSTGAQERDDNLIFVRDRILRSEADHVALLDMYGQILAGKKIKNDESNPLVSILRLSGIVRMERGRLVVRNRIYAHVFNREWTLANTPYAEVLRQEKAYRQGALRTAAAFCLLFVVIGSLAFAAIQNARRAVENARRADAAALLADRQAANAGRLLYASDMNLIQREWEANNIGHVLDLLKETQDNPERNFEWNYWNRLTHRSAAVRVVPGDLFHCVAISPDGNKIAFGNEAGNGLISVLNNDLTGSLRAYDTGTNLPLGMAFLPDGKRLVFRTYEYDFAILDLKSGQITRKQRRAPPTREPDGLTLSPDGTQIASVLETGAIRVINLGSGAVHNEPKTDPIMSGVCWAQDSRHLYCGDKAGGVTLRDAETFKSALTFACGNRAAHLFALSPKAPLLAVALWNGVIELWNTATGQRINILRGHTLHINAMSFSPDGALLASASDDSATLVHDVTTGELRTPLKDSRAPLLGVFWQKNGKTLLTADRYGELRRYAATGAVGIPLSGKPPLWGVDYARDGSRFAVAASDGLARVYDAKTGKFFLALRGHTGRVCSVKFSPDGTRLLTAGDDGDARVWDATTGACILPPLRHKDVLKKAKKGVNSAIFSADGHWIVTGGVDGSAALWDAQTGAFLKRFGYHTNAVEALALTADNGRLVTCSDDSTARVWNVATGEVIKTLRGVREMWGVALFPDGKRMVTTDLDNTAQIWNLDTGQQINKLEGHTDWLVSAAVSPDGRRIVTSSKDMTAKVWDAETGRELLTLTGHRDEVTGVAFSSDGRRILTAGRDGTARIWFSD